MKSVTCQKTINASIEDVFAFATDLENAPANIPSVESLEILTEGETGVGTRFTQKRTILGTSLNQEMTVVEFEPPVSYGAEASAHGCKVIARMKLSEAGETTEVDAEVVVEPEGFAGKLAAPMILKGAQIAMLEDLETVKNALESP